MLAARGGEEKAPRVRIPFSPSTHQERCCCTAAFTEWKFSVHNPDFKFAFEFFLHLLSCNLRDHECMIFFNISSNLHPSDYPFFLLDTKKIYIFRTEERLQLFVL